MLVGFLAACTGGGPGGSDSGLGVGTVPVPPDNIPPDGTPTVSAYLAGRFAVVAAYEGIASVYGSVLLTRKLDGTASFTMAATGLAPDLEHTAHVHTWPCSYEGGGHYLYDPALVDAGETNEIWMRFTPDADGNAWGYTSVDYAVRGDAMSIVIHEPTTGDKLACADLLPEQKVGATASGSFYPFALYETIDETITGSADLVMAGTSTVNVSLAGLPPADGFSAHVHVFPCDVLDAGGHYKLDPSVVDTLAENEVWPTFTANAEGGATSSVTVPNHMMREDAASVVIHRLVGNEYPKVACADLARAEYLPLATFGYFAAQGGSTVNGSATLTRRLDGATVLAVDVAGLTPSTAYKAGLHTLPCGVAGGGPMYYDQPDDGGLVVELTAQPTGAATRQVGYPWTARAEAQSVVLAGADGTVIGCADLE